jgi:glycosyltransferase involved in cell wall biosynthesis
MAIKISLVAPAYNEQGSIEEFVKRSDDALKKQKVNYEILIIDDASTDRTPALLENLKKKYHKLRVLRNHKNLGLTGTIWRGFNEAKGEVIVFLPSDLESDPKDDVPALLSALGKDSDMVVGWRYNQRQGIIKTIVSLFFNSLSSMLFHIKVHDLGWIKAFKKEIIYNIEPMRSDWHRFFVIFAANEGYRIREIKTRFHPRRTGESKFGKFGMKRLFGGFFDMIVIKFNLSFSKKPMFVFGSAGMLLFLLGLIGGMYLLFVKITEGAIGNRMPLMFLIALLLILGIQFFALGFIAELLVSAKQLIKK